MYVSWVRLLYKLQNFIENYIINRSLKILFFSNTNSKILKSKSETLKHQIQNKLEIITKETSRRSYLWLNMLYLVMIISGQSGWRIELGEKQKPKG